MSPFGDVAHDNRGEVKGSSTGTRESAPVFQHWGAQKEVNFLWITAVRIHQNAPAGH